MLILHFYTLSCSHWSLGARTIFMSSSTTRNIEKTGERELGSGKRESVTKIEGKGDRQRDRERRERESGMTGM